jgi:lysine 2,3-aminomutase
MFAAMTDIGKITFYHGTIVKRRDGKLLLQSEYRLEDRLAWNPSWQLPDSAQVDSEGRLQVWYLDGAD